MKSELLKKVIKIILFNILIAALIIMIGRKLNHNKYETKLFTSFNYKIDNDTTITICELLEPINFDQIRNQLASEDWVESYSQSRIITSDNYSLFKKYTTPEYQKFTAQSLIDYNKHKSLSTQLQSRLLYWIIESGKSYQALYTVENAKPYQAVQFANVSRFFLLENGIWKATPNDNISKINKLRINDIIKLKSELGVISNYQPVKSNL